MGTRRSAPHSPPRLRCIIFYSKSRSPPHLHRPLDNTGPLVHSYSACPNCSSKREATEIYECRTAIGGCGQTFCRQCAGGLTTGRCPACREPVFMGSVVQTGTVQPDESPARNS